MKALRPTSAKTRKGVIAWLAKYNPFLKADWLYHSPHIVAVHIHKYTGAVVSYEHSDGTLESHGPYLYYHVTAA